MGVYILIGLFLLVFLVMIVGITISSVTSDVAKVGKWLGLGAIAGNVVNNKNNADATAKQGKAFKKSKIQTGHKSFDTAINFISPSTEEVDNGKTGAIFEEQAEQLKTLKELLDSGILSQEEFEMKKKQLLDL